MLFYLVLQIETETIYLLKSLDLILNHLYGIIARALI